MNENKFEEFKAVLATTPLTQEFMYSEETNQFLVRVSIAGAVIGIGVVPEDEMMRLAEIAEKIDLSNIDFVENDTLNTEE